MDATSCDEYVQYHDRKLWYWEEYYLKLTSGWSPRSFPSLCVDLTNVCEQSVQNISRERFNNIQYSDHVKSQYSVILLHISRSWIYFINQKLHRIIQTNHSFFRRMLNWIICTHEQFWFLWFSWALWPNWNENQILVYRSFTIPVVFVKWKEKTYLLKKKYIFVCSSNASLTWQSTIKKIHQRSWRRSFVFSRKSVI